MFMMQMANSFSHRKYGVGHYTFENGIELMPKFTELLKESCRLRSDVHFFVEVFSRKKVSPKQSDLLTALLSMIALFRGTVTVEAWSHTMVEFEV